MWSLSIDFRLLRARVGDCTLYVHNVDKTSIWEYGQMFTSHFLPTTYAYAPISNDQSEDEIWVFNRLEDSKKKWQPIKRQRERVTTNQKTEWKGDNQSEEKMRGEVLIR